MLLEERLMTVAGSCHCGAVRIEVPGAPEWVARCNCSICRKLGQLVAYYPDDGSVRIAGRTAEYIWGDRMIAFHFCPVCGCHSNWTSTGESYGRVGVNARLLDGYEERDGKSLFDGREVEVRSMDNAER
jgi:hypothetical protein